MVSEDHKQNWQVIALSRLSHTRVLPPFYSCRPVRKLNNIMGAWVTDYSLNLGRNFTVN